MLSYEETACMSFQTQIATHNPVLLSRKRLLLNLLSNCWMPPRGVRFTRLIKPTPTKDFPPSSHRRKVGDLYYIVILMVTVPRNCESRPAASNSWSPIWLI